VFLASSYSEQPRQVFFDSTLYFLFYSLLTSKSEPDTFYKHDGDRGGGYLTVSPSALWEVFATLPVLELSLIVMSVRCRNKIVRFFYIARIQVFFLFQLVHLEA